MTCAWIGGRARVERWLRATFDALTFATALAGAAACERPQLESAEATSRPLALALPTYGETISIDFKTDAVGAPLARAAVLAEQYAAAGIHFQGGLVLGDRAVDFADFQTPSPDNLLCVRRLTDGRCAGAPASDPNLVITFDYPVCAVSIVGFSSPSIISTGVVGVVGIDATGNVRDSWSSRQIYGGNGVYSKVAWLPGTGPDYPGSPNPSPSLDLHSVTFFPRSVVALDNLLVTRCKEIVPRCKPAVVCVGDGQACVSPATVNINDGSYSSTGAALTLTHSPAGPYAEGPLTVQLTATDGVRSESCYAAVTVGHCDVAQIDCPASVVAECATTMSGIPESRTCTYYNKSVEASDGCRQNNLGPVSPLRTPCIPPGVATPVEYVAKDLRGVEHKCTTTVTFVDRKPPEFTIQDFKQLTTVDGQMYAFTLADLAMDKALDACELELSGPGQVAIDCITSDEPNSGSSPDIEIVDAATFRVRASRSSNGDGRVYRVSAVARDSAGNIGEGPAKGSIEVARDPGVQVVESAERQKVCRPRMWPAGGSGGVGGRGGTTGAGGAAGGGGTTATGGAAGGGGVNASGGRAASGGATATGGVPATGGVAGTSGGDPGTAGATSTGGVTGSGGGPAVDGGVDGSGGATPGSGTGGTTSTRTGGRSGSGGRAGEGGKAGDGGSETGGCTVASAWANPSVAPIFVVLAALVLYVRPRRRRF